MTDKQDVGSGAFYIDGSCRPHNPGFVGWGVHGYFYKDTCEKPVAVEQFIHTTHGYMAANETPTNNAKPVIPTQYLDGYGSNPDLLTNNVAEILGLRGLLEYLTNFKLTTVRIYTDSEYLKTCMNDWCKRWEKTNWIKQDGTPVSNRELLEKTYGLLKKIKETGVEISIHWIRSHNGHIGNERADVLAGIGMSHSQQRSIVSKIELSPVKGYWKSDVERNPYVAFRRLYFNSLNEYNQSGVYHLAESPDSEFIIGKPSASTGYSVVYLKDPDLIIEMIKNKQFEISRNINVILLMKLDSIYSRHVYPWLESHGSYAIVGQKNSHSMVLVDKKPITVEMNPTGLSLRAIDYFAMLEELLLNFRDSTEEQRKAGLLLGAREVSSHDITDKFFTTVVDKKGNVKYELLPEFVVGFKNMTLNLEIEHNGKQIPVKIPYALGYDCLPRNNLKYLESAEPKIFLLTWKEENILRYATVIISGFGIGIWSNYFSNQVILPG